jgi:hypothetical protein
MTRRMELARLKGENVRIAYGTIHRAVNPFRKPQRSSSRVEPGSRWGSVSANAKHTENQRFERYVGWVD